MARTVLDELITIIGFKGDTRDLDRVQQRVKQVQSNINMMARNFGIAGAALTGVGFVVGRTILSFDRAMNTLRATFLDAPTEELLKLEKQAKLLGAETSKSATDAANAQVELARAGLSTNQVMDAIPSVLNLAIAGELEMAEAAGLVTNQLASFRLETTETERVVDVLAKTATSSRTTVAELGPAFRQVAPLAAGLGIEIEQTAAIIGTLRSGGLIPEQAGTAFRNILAILQEDPTSRVRDGFKQLGLEFEDVRQMVTEGDLVGAIKLISEAGLDTKTALQIFGREAASGASSLALAAEEVDEFIQRLDTAEGTTVRMAEVMAGGLPGSVDQFRSSLESLQLELGDSGLRGLMTKALDTIRDFLRWITNAPGPLKTLLVAVIAAGPVLLGLAAGLKAVSFALSGLVPLLKIAAWANKQFGISTTFAAIANSKFVVSLKASRIGMLLTAAAARVTWASILGPVAALAAVGFMIYKFRRQILGALKAVWSWIKGNWPLLVGILLGPFGIVGALVWKFRDDIVGAIMWIKDKIMAIFTSLRDFVIGIWQGLGAAIGGAFRGVINAVISGLNKALDAASSFVEAIKGALDKAPFGNPLGDFLLGVASKLRAGIPNFAIGGIVPGPLGRPLLATVHGGEMVLPVGASRVIAQMLEGFRLGPAALPQAPYHYGQMYRSSVTNRTVNINMNEPIVIQTQATDAKGIAQEIGEAMEDQIRNIAYDHDGPVER